MQLFNAHRPKGPQGKSDLERCLETKKGAGVYRYGRRGFECDLDGFSSEQDYFETLEARTLNGKVMHCEIVRVPGYKNNPKAIVAIYNGDIIGHMYAENLEYLHRWFDEMGDESIRLVGTLSVEQSPERDAHLVVIVKMRVGKQGADSRHA